MIATAEVPIPNAVLNNASEIPFDNSRAASPPPSSPRAENDLIIPNTVPNKPNRVATEAIVDKNTKFFSNIGNSRAVASSISFWIFNTFCSVSNSVLLIISLYFLRPAFITLPTEPFCLSQAAKALSTSLLARWNCTLRTNSALLAVPVALITVNRRSITKINTMMKLPIKIGTTIPPSYILASPVKAPLWLGQKPPAKSGLVKLLLVPSTNLQRMYPITTPAKGAIHEIMLLLFFG